GYSDHAAYYLVGSGVIGLVGLVQVTAAATADPEVAAAVYGLFAMLCLATNVRWRRAWMTSLGLALAMGASLWTLEAVWPVLAPHPDLEENNPIYLGLWAATWALEGLLLALAGRSFFQIKDASDNKIGEGRSWRQAFGWPVVLFAELSAAVAVICGFVSSGSAPWLITHALAATALFLLYLLLTTFQPYIRQARLAGAMLVASVLATSGWAGTAADVADRAALIGLCLAGASTLMAIVSVLAAVETRINPSAWFVVVARAW